MSDATMAPAQQAFDNYIGGEWKASESGRTYERHSPYRPDETVGRFPSSAEQDVAAAVDAAAETLREWSRTPAAARGAILTKAAALIDERVEQIALDMTREMGKPLREARMEAARAAQIFRFFAGEGW